MKAIHLLQNDPTLKPWPIENKSEIYDSGYWDVTPKRAEELIGKEIYFYETQRSASFFGGIILSFRIEPYRIKADGQPKDRIIFRFTPGREFRGRKTGPEGWSMEMKFED